MELSNSDPTNGTRISKHTTLELGHSELVHRQRAYEVTSLPNFTNLQTFYSQGYLQHAGEIKLSHGINYFFWLVHHKVPKGKLLIWLNGGPGCTSTDGLILERGVFNIERVKDQLELSARSDGWHSFTNVLALDQPVGTGYSNGPNPSYATTLDQVAGTFDEFLTVFFELFPDYAKDEVYLGGESFAGIWIPTFANYTLRRPEASKVNLKGLFIDSGWIDPKNQYPSILPMVEKYKLLPLDKTSDFKGYVDQCMETLNATSITTATVEECETMVKQVNELSIRKDATGKEMCINQYDFRLRDEYPKCGMGWPPSISEFYEYMKREDVASALNTKLPDGEWEECASKVYSELDMRLVPPTIDLFPNLLKQVSILLFTGEYDFMVNSIGMDYLVGNLTKRLDQNRLKVSDPDEGKWRGWGIDPRVESGQLARWGNLVQATVFNASHMASYDQPLSVGSLMRWFVLGRPSSGVVPEPNSAPGFFYTSKLANHSIPDPPQPNQTASNSTAVPTTVPTTVPVVNKSSSSSSSATWVGVVVAFAVLGCFVVGLMRSRHRSSSQSDHQELLQNDETEMDTTHHHRNSGDDYAFDFHDSDDEGLMNPSP